jgi:hypothetical protein
MLGNDFNPITGQIELVESYEYNPALTSVLYEDWTARTQTGSGWNWQQTNVGTTWSTNIIASTTLAMGIMRQQITHSAANTATSVNNLGTITKTITGSGIITVESRMWIEANTTNVTARELWIGLSDTTTVTPTNAVFIGFAGLTAANPNWQGRKIEASAITTSASVVAPVANSTWTYLKYVINAASTSVEFFVNNVSITTLALTGTARSMFPAYYMRSVSSAAATQYGNNQDFYKVTHQFTNPRF